MALTQNEILKNLLKDRSELLAYAWSWVRDVHIAEDLFQEVCLAAVEKRDQIHSISHLKGWVRKALRYECVNVMRKMKVENRLIQSDVAGLLDVAWADSSEEISDNQFAEALVPCLEKLTPYMRKVIDLRYFEGLKGAKLANRLDRKLETVYTALTRAHNALRECMTKSISSEQGGRYA